MSNSFPYLKSIYVHDCYASELFLELERQQLEVA
jgi:hypothetical protein